MYLALLLRFEAIDELKCRRNFEKWKIRCSLGVL